MTIYQQGYCPFFYIIQDTVNGMYYAGCRWAINASPSTFMTKSGYKTSSKIIKQLIKKYGLSRFKIKKIKEFENDIDCRIYETRFLRKVNAKKNTKFYNKSNGDGSFNLEAAKETWLEKYGVDSPLKSELIHEKIKETNLDRYGVERPLSSPEVQQKIKETNLERYGVDNVLKSPEIRKRIEETNLERYGVDNPVKSDIIREKIKQTNLDKYGVDNASKCPEIAAKISESNKKYYEHNTHHRTGKSLDDETKEKLRQANLGKTHAEESKHKMSETRKNKIWIKKDEECKHINQDDFEYYTNLGWERGRILGQHNKKRPPLTQDQKDKLSKILSKRIWIKKEGEKSKHIDIDDFIKWENEGWERGRGDNGRKKKS